MKQLNLNNHENFPMVHFYSFDRMINTFSNVIINEGDTFHRNGYIFEITSVKRENVTPTYQADYSYNTDFYYLKYKPSNRIININQDS